MNSQLANDSTIQDTLNEAANQLKNHFIREEGSAYSVADLRQALSNWLDLSNERPRRKRTGYQISLF